MMMAEGYAGASRSDVLLEDETPMLNLILKSQRMRAESRCHQENLPGAPGQLMCHRPLQER